MVRIYEIKLKLGEDKRLIPQRIQEKLKTTAPIGAYTIAAESIDARDKKNILFVYTVDFEFEHEKGGGRRVQRAGAYALETAPDLSYSPPAPGTAPLSSRPVIVGFGPCGMFAALILAECGYRPIVLERGKSVEARIADVRRFWKEGLLLENSNVQFGEGGAGTFSDGKLTAGRKDKRARKVLTELVAAGAGEAILYAQKPHIGTDVLRIVVSNLRKKIIAAGGEIRFETRLDNMRVDEAGRLAALVTSPTGVAGGLAPPTTSPAEAAGGLMPPPAPQENAIAADVLLLAVGHSARDTIRALYAAGLPMAQKPFSIGLRIEHPQSLINEAQYGREAAALLPPATYQLAHHCQNGRGVYTFCMCPGGSVIVASSQAGGVVTNGMSTSARDGPFANSGLLVDVRPSDFESENPLAGIIFQEKYERIAFQRGGGHYDAPKTTWGAFAADSAAAKPVTDCLPAFAAAALREAMPQLARRVKGFDQPDAALYAVESRSSAPFRILRNERCESSVPGVYAGGEGAGYAGGIVSAAADGIRIAEEIVIKYSNTAL